MTDEGALSIRLTKDEALVLLEIIGDFRDESAIQVRDQAERHALWNLSALLEKAIPEIFAPNYRELVKAAKKNLS